MPGIAAADVEVGPIEQVSAPGIASTAPVLATAADGHAWAAFTAIDPVTDTETVQVAERRNDLGWSAPTVLSGRTADAGEPTISSNSQGDVCVAWVEESWAHQRLHASCVVDGVWSDSTPLGPLATRIENVDLDVAESGRAVIAFSTVSTDLSSVLLHAAYADSGQWGTSSTLDVVGTSQDDVADVRVLQGEGDAAAVVWRNDDAVLSSLRQSTGVWSAPVLEYAGSATTLAGGSRDGRMIAAWWADGSAWITDVAEDHTPRSVPASEALTNLSVVVNDDGIVLLGQDPSANLRAIAVDAEGRSAGIDLGIASAGHVAAPSKSGFDVALLDDSSAITFSHVTLGTIPFVSDSQSLISEDDVVVTWSDSRPLIVWVDSGPPTAVLAAEPTLATGVNERP